MNPFRRSKPRTPWERVTDVVTDPSTTRAGKRGLLALGAVVGASIASALVSSVRDNQESSS